MTAVIPLARPLIGPAERAAVDRVLRSGLLAQGPEVARFESEFAACFGLRRSCVAVNSGTSGLLLGLIAAGVRPGDEIVVPSFTFAATANAVALAGARPVFADIDPRTYCLDPAAVRAALTPRTVAVMPVHLYGHPADVPALIELVNGSGLQIFEDAAQAHGAALHGRPVGTFGTFGVFSLYPTKNMTSGEGGMVAAADAGTERTLRLLRNQGMQERYHHEIVGFNNRMTDIHAAIGRVQLTRIQAWTAARQANARFLSEHLDDVVTPFVATGATHVFHQYTVRIADERDRFALALRDEYGIASGTFYSRPAHRLPPFDARWDLPETMRAAAECLSLPVHPALSAADLDRIVDAVNSVAKAGG